MLEEDGEPIDAARWSVALSGAGATEVDVIAASTGRPPAAADLDRAAGVYVAGGWTPGYRDVFVDGPGAAAWRERLVAGAIPYAGFSAGAAIVSATALVGGWRIDGRPVCDQDAGEDLDEVEPRPGLGLLDAVVDPHAAQWGTLTRALDAVAAGLVPAAWAIDEHTCLELSEGRGPRVHGRGAARWIEPVAGGANVSILTAGR